MLISSYDTNEVASSYDVSLSISISLVEGDTFGPGDSFHAIVEIRNREAEGRVDVVVTYKVLNLDGDIILSDSKTVAVETKASFAEGFDLPVWIEEGPYSLMANVSTLDGSKWSKSIHSFSVVYVSEGEQRVVEYILIGAIVVTSGGLIYEHRRVSKLKFSGKDFEKFIERRKK